ncbi:MAG: ABC-F family ATP-binding cassette domain-containing protein [Bacteroidales bacterium]|nr:ABC-F family ATP-binding cassette domain-containing protein [Bacteroidales bacterium]
MNFIQVENLTKSFGEKLLFEDISFDINRGDKKALIARNGAGKTSLINIIMGNDIQDSGKVTIRPEMKIRYLPQNPKFEKGITVGEAIYNTENDFVKTIQKYHETISVYEKDNSEANLRAMDQATARMDAMQAWDYDARMTEILDKFKIKDLSQDVSTLSGGQQKKVALASVLIDVADLLILDEPTNHLDLEMIRWLESYLSKSNLSVFMVTHDRYFLDNVCDSILELDRKTMRPFHGNYSYYVAKKAELIELEKRSIEKAQNIYRTELDWMRRMPQARATKAKARIDAFYDLEERAKKRIHEDKTEFSVNAARLGKKILELYNVSKSFGDKTYIKDFSYIFKHAEKIGIAGLNGTGKSTLLNMIAGDLHPDHGSITRGTTMQLGYYRQEGFIDGKERRVIDIMKEIAEEVNVGKGTVSTSVFLQHFGFSPTEQYAYFSTLSGGEKRKLYLLMILMQNPNFLILDEPTNDLDIATLNALEDFLGSFPGCILIVSHDRWFMDKLADHIFAFEGEGNIKDFPGNYTQYLNYKEEKEAQARHQKELEEKLQKPVKEKPKTSLKPSYKIMREYELLETEIADLEAEKDNLTEKLNHGGTTEELTQWSVEIATILKTIDEKMERWMEISMLIQ